MKIIIPAIIITGMLSVPVFADLHAPTQRLDAHNGPCPTILWENITKWVHCRTSKHH